MAGTLSIVATPIGNLEDITLRALSVLRSADLIAAEDTRRTGQLLAHFGISTKTLSFHEHNAHARRPVLLAHLDAGRSVALVSDAGTPILSDPGLDLVQDCIARGIAVDAVPGASAPLTLAVMSGFPMAPWTIFGFPPQRSNDRKAWWSDVVSTPHTVSFLEAPHRIRRTLEEMADLFGERPIVVGRELTKLHQTIYRGSATSIAAAGVEPRGEFTVMLGPAVIREDTHIPPADEQISLEFGSLTENNGGSRRDILRVLAKRHGIPVRDVYAALERQKTR